LFFAKTRANLRHVNPTWSEFMPKSFLVALLIGFASAVLIAFHPALLSPSAALHHEIVAAALAIPAAEPLALTIRGFCKTHGLSVASYYALKRLGRGPREMHLAGNLIRISIEAAAEWRAARENPKAAEVKEFARLAEQRQERSRKAAKKATESPEHPANRGRV
jgi:hypothetical protein